MGLAIVLSVAACAPTTRPARARNVVLITLDTTRHDIIGVYGDPAGFTPRIDAVAARGVVFDNAYSTAPFTGPAHASILTGQHPSTHGIVFNGSRVMAKISTESISLAEHLRARGFATGAVVSNGVLHERYGFARGFDSYAFYNDAQPGDQGGSAAGVRHHAIEFLDSVSGDRPFFLWAHFIEPHLPYVVSEEVQRRFGLDDRTMPIEEAKDASAERLRRVYGGEVYETDAEVGAILDHVEVLGRLEETLVVITADHGEYLQEHGLLDHSLLYDEVLHIPWIMAGPGIKPGSRHPDPVSVIDIPDTVTDALAIDAMPSSQGVGQWRRQDGVAADRPVFAEWRHYRMILAPDEVRPATDFLVSVQQRGYKLILPVLADSRRQLFDLTDDPGEMENLILERTALAEELTAIHRRHVATDLPHGILGAEGVEIDESSMEMLRQLGYVD
jgi:arylsulfatase A-like enzyme